MAELIEQECKDIENYITRGQEVAENIKNAEYEVEVERNNSDQARADAIDQEIMVLQAEYEEKHKAHTELLMEYEQLFNHTDTQIREINT